MNPRLSKKGKGESPVLILRVPEELRAQLVQLAAAMDRPVSYAARLLMEEALAARKKRK